MSVKIIILFGMIFVLSSFASANTIYVDDSGGKDYAKIQDAVNAANAGDNILVHPGTYHEEIVIAKQGLTIAGTDPNNPPQIDGADQNFNPSWIHVQGKIYKTPYTWYKPQVIDEDFLKPYYIRRNNHPSPMLVYEDNVHLRGYRNRHDPDYSYPPGYTFGGGAYRTLDELNCNNDNGDLPAWNIKPSICNPGRFLYDEANTELYVWGADEDHPTNHNYFIPVIHHLIKVAATDVTLKNLVIKHAGGFGVFIQKGSDGAVFENNYLINCHFGMRVESSNNVIIRNNMIRDQGFWERHWYDDAKLTMIGEYLIQIVGWQDSRNVDIYNNIISGDYGILAHGQDMKIHGNIFSKSISLGINPTDATIARGLPSNFQYNLQVYDNIFHHMDFSAIALSFLELGPVWFYRNTIYATRYLHKEGATIPVEATGEKYIYHNTFALGKQIVHHSYASPVRKNTHYRNNIFHLRFKGMEMYWVYTYKKPTLGWSYFPFVNGPDSDYNLFWRDAIDWTQISWFHLKTDPVYKKYMVGEFELMKQETGLDPHSCEQNPQFKNEISNIDVYNLNIDTFSNMDYRNVILQGYNNLYNQHFKAIRDHFKLKSGSPAINSGFVIPSNWPDTINVIDGKPDIGAHEYLVVHKGGLEYPVVPINFRIKAQ